MSPIRKPVCRCPRIIASNRSWPMFFSPSRVGIRSIAPTRSARSSSEIGSAGASPVFGAFSPSGRIRFNPTLRQNPSEKRLHTFQPLEARDRRTRPGLPKSTGLIDAELRDVDDALLHAKLHQEVRKLAVLFESARRQLASLPVVRKLFDHVSNCGRFLGGGTGQHGGRDVERPGILPLPLDFLGLWPFHLAGCLANETVETEGTLGVDGACTAAIDRKSVV